ncbi:MAG: rod shape-determining protein [Actinomycetota bacterium]
MRRDLAIDLGTANVSVLVRGESVVVSEPAVVARLTDTGEVVAVGREAERMVGRTHDRLETVRPFGAGAVLDTAAARELIRAVLRLAGIRRRHRVRAVVAVPSPMTALEQRAVLDALAAAGVLTVRLVGHTMAAAVGCRLPVEQPVGSLVVDVGAGTTEAAVLSLGGVVALEWRPLGGLDLDREIQALVERRHGVTIDRPTADGVKRALAPGAARWPLTVRGRSASVAAAAELERQEVVDAIDEPIRSLVDVVVACAGWVPPEIAADLTAGGVHLVGGTAQLDGLAARIGEACRLPVHPVVDPGAVIVRGAARLLGRFDGPAEVFLDGVPAPSDRVPIDGSVSP